MRGRVLLIASAFCVVAARGVAQELDVYDLNDFIDPRQRGAMFDESGSLNSPGDTFTLVRAMLGTVADYTTHTGPTSEQTRFIYLTSAHYWGSHQANLKVTRLSADTNAVIPGYRASLEYGHYFSISRMPAVNDAGVKELVWVPERFLLRAMTEQVRAGGGSREYGRYNRELTMGLDAALPFGKKSQAIGTWTLTYRDEPGEHPIFRWTYLSRFPPFHVGQVRTEIDFGYGWEKTESLHWAPTRIVVLSSLDVHSLGGSLNVAWVPTYAPASAERRFFQEVSIFVDFRLFARLKAVPPRPRG